MKRRILTIGAIAIMSISLLAGCDSKNDYKSEVKEFEKCVNTVKKSTKKIDSNDFEDSDFRNKYIKDMQKLIDDVDVSTKEGKELRDDISDFWNVHAEYLILGENAQNVDEEKFMDDFDKVDDAFDDFCDAAEDKGANVEKLVDIRDAIAKEIN